MPTITCDSPEVIAICRETITHAVEHLAHFEGHVTDTTLQGARMYVVGYLNALLVQGLISVDTLRELDAEKEQALKGIGAPV